MKLLFVLYKYKYKYVIAQGERGWIEIEKISIWYRIVYPNQFFKTPTSVNVLSPANFYKIGYDKNNMSFSSIQWNAKFVPNVFIGFLIFTGLTHS